MTGAATWDVAIVGAGAAGLATAIFTARAAPSLRVVCLDGASHIGAKILVSGGSRCNVTNRIVSEHDFWGGSPRVVRYVLRSFPAPRAAQFFESLGVALHEEEDGKLFPDTNRARTVLDSLLREAARLRISVQTGARVAAVAGTEPFTITLRDQRTVHAAAVVLATGGRSLPKTGSDGTGYQLAQSLGHTIVETTPGLAPLVLDGERHVSLAGRSHPATLTLRVRGRTGLALTGSLLWTHFGISGPVALNMSRHWHRAMLGAAAPDEVAVSLNVCPGETRRSLEEFLQNQVRERPRAQVATVLATRLPAAVADMWAAGIAGETTLSHLSRADRRTLVEALLDTPLQVLDSRGYNYAEVTAGGVPLEEIDHRSMESRRCRGLYLVGEILDVDGRLGGFNFQWAWSSGWVAGHAIARRLASGGGVFVSVPAPSSWLVMHRHLLPLGDALDIACGRGRHALWLAGQGCRVTAVDRDADALHALSNEARRRGVAIVTEQRDLERGSGVLPADAFDVIVVVHYLHRPLFPQLIAALRPGGLLVYETFTTAQAARGKPTNPDFLLRPGELRELVSPLQILASREGEFDGRDVASVVARRPSATSG